ncbi:hypothetical protein AMECASPLE_021551 [Ameca splendens]|uniref:Sleeping Beauty transposase HTH domain-containing protein n=1 Tax=Ameca splendens TaxID=208324 RepID=A0ABV0Z1V5_9TELE
MKIIEINQDIRKSILDLHKSDSSFDIISRCLKEPASSAQTIIGKPEQHGNVQEGDGFCKPEINMQNVGINHPNCEVRGWLHHVVGVLSCKRDRCWFGTLAQRNHTSQMSPNLKRTPSTSRCDRSRASHVSWKRATAICFLS